MKNWRSPAKITRSKFAGSKSTESVPKIATTLSIRNLVLGIPDLNTNSSPHGGIGEFLNEQSSNALLSAELVSPCILVIALIGSPEVTIIVCYSPTNVAGVLEAETFCNQLSETIVRKQDLYLVLGDFNANVVKDIYKHAFAANTDRNGDFLHGRCIEKRLTITNTKFQKK